MLLQHPSPRPQVWMRGRHMCAASQDSPLPPPSLELTGFNMFPYSNMSPLVDFNPLICSNT